jgi:ribonuclease D
VIYLVDVYRNLHDRLVARGRLEWLDEDFARLSSDALYSNPPEDAWLRVKGANRLKGAALAVLQALAGWRETLAQQRDRPRGWILRDDALLEIARHRPSSLEALGRIRGVQEAFIRHNGEQVIGLVAAAGKQRPIPLVDGGSRLQLTPAQDALVDVMSAVVRLSGAEHAINPAVLASRKQLERLVSGDADVEILHGWRRKLVGERLQALLAGELSLSVRDGKLVL